MRLFWVLTLCLAALTSCKKNTTSTENTSATPASTQAGSPDAADAVSGAWRITQAASPNGEAYTGTVNFRKLAENVYAVEWTTSAGNYPGVGIREGNNLFIGWGLNADHGIALYTQEGNKLVGRWTASQQNGKMGTETITLSGGGLAGRHTAKGTPPGGGSEYTFNVTVTESGPVLNFTWSGEGSQYSGVGLKVGNQVAVGWGMGPNHGLVHYTLSGNSAQGKWTIPGMNTTATENIAR
jgi:hypothetical protein